MAKNEKKISITTMDKIIKENFNSTVVAEWHGADVIIKTHIALKDVLELVNNVVDSCFQEDGGFMPEIKDFAFNCNVIDKYTNISLPSNLEHKHEIIYGSDIIAFVYQHIDTAQLAEIVSAINTKISHLCNTNAISIQRQMNELISAFENMQAQTADMFSNITPEDISKIMGAVSEKGISEEKIVEAYINQTRPVDAEVEGQLSL